LSKIYSKNKKAYHDYEMIDCIEAGISLQGTEVKSIRKSQVNLKGSYVTIDGKFNSVKLVNCHISRPDHISHNKKHDETRDKYLLLHKKEIQKFYNKVQEKGFTLIVTEIYQPENSKKIKAKLYLAKGKHTYDKKRALKEKQLDIETKRMMKDY
jgi:SsrA-binding protein